MFQKRRLVLKENFLLLDDFNISIVFFHFYNCLCQGALKLIVFVVGLKNEPTQGVTLALQIVFVSSSLLNCVFVLLVVNKTLLQLLFKLLNQAQVVLKRNQAILILIFQIGHLIFKFFSPQLQTNFTLFELVVF